MTALFDSGNSRLHYGWWRQGELLEADSVPYPETADGLKELFDGLFRNRRPSVIAACSVSSKWRDELFRSLHGYTDTLKTVRSAADTGVRVHYDRIGSVGVDRVLAAHAAYRFVQGACVVIDIGTAVTVDVVGDDGTFLGGFIFPGAELLAWSLAQKTSLPAVEIPENARGIGHSTEMCIANAVSTGFRGALSSLVETARGTAGEKSRIVLSGGGAARWRTHLPFDSTFLPHLVLKGLGMLIDRLPVDAATGHHGE